MIRFIPERKEQVDSCLKNNPPLADFINEFEAQVENVFGDKADKIELTVNEENLEKIFAYIYVNYFSTDAVAIKADELYQGWFVNNMGRAKGCFAYDFIIQGEDPKLKCKDFIPELGVMYPLCDNNNCQRKKDCTWYKDYEDYNNPYNEE